MDGYEYRFLDREALDERHTIDVSILLCHLSSKYGGREVVSAERFSQCLALGHAVVALTETKVVVGMAWLFPLVKLGEVVGLVEDVVVDPSCRGSGISKELMRRLIEKARELGCSHLDLTSAPAREAANGLYQRLGFAQRTTNNYRLVLS